MNTLIDKKRIHAIFIGHSQMSTQEFLVPNMLRECGYEMSVRYCYGPGQSFKGHLENNRGVVTDEQKEGIERGRIGGWFSDEKCELLYDIARSKKGYLDDALAAMTYDVAFIIAGREDVETAQEEKTRGYFRQICEMLRANNPDIRIVFVSFYAPLAWRPERLDLHMWAAKRFAAEFGCRVAPVAPAMRQAEEKCPDAWFYRSRKDLHPNELGCFLIAYCYIAAMFDNRLENLPTHFPEMVKPANEHGPERVFSLEDAFGKVFRDAARSATAEVIAELEGLTLETLKKPVIEEEETKTSPLSADRKILVIGNAYFDADGAVWKELAASFQARNEQTLHVETLTDDAATFESILANDAGDLTKRQQGILERVGRSVASMGDGCDMDALDGLGDFPVKNALEFILARKGQLDKALAMDVSWDAILVQPFRGALAPDEHNFFEAGAALIEKIRSARPNCPVYLMQPWKYQDADPSDQDVMNRNCDQLARQCGLPVIPVGQAWRKTEKTRSVSLYAGKYTPNRLGIQLVSEEIRKVLLA
jgi:hypothetical protein